MKITVTARHYELTSALKDYAEKKVYNLKRYFDHIVKAHITFSMEKYRHVVEVSVHVNGKDFNSKEASEDMYASVDKVVDKLERQILKYKGKRTRRKAQAKLAEIGYDYQASPLEEKEEEVVIPAHADEFPPLQLQDALEQMKGNGSDYAIFTDPVTRRLNILYRRKDGKIGLIKA